MLLIDVEKSYVHVQGKVNAQAGSGTYDFFDFSDFPVFSNMFWSLKSFVGMVSL